MEKYLDSPFVDQIYNYKGIWDVNSLCGLKVVDKENQVIVIATELYDDNPGTSITDCNTKLAMHICNEMNFDPKKMIFVEHTPEKETKLSFNRESFFKVSFQIEGEKFVDPDWEELSKEQIQTMIER